LKAVALLEAGFSPVQVARQLGVDRRSVRRWRASYDQAGQEGVRAKPVPGRPWKLDAQARKRLARDLLSGAKAFGYPTNLWTCPRVAQLIQRRYRVAYHVDHVSRLLRSMGWTPQKPERRARERDERTIRGWIRKDWPQVKKTRRG
jgi:transposase